MACMNIMDHELKNSKFYNNVHFGWKYVNTSKTDVTKILFFWTLRPIPEHSNIFSKLVSMLVKTLDNSLCG